MAAKRYPRLQDASKCLSFSSRLFQSTTTGKNVYPGMTNESEGSGEEMEGSSSSPSETNVDEKMELEDSGFSDGDTPSDHSPASKSQCSSSPPFSSSPFSCTFSTSPLVSSSPSSFPSSFHSSSSPSSSSSYSGPSSSPSSSRKARESSPDVVITAVECRKRGERTANSSGTKAVTLTREETRTIRPDVTKHSHVPVTRPVIVFSVKQEMVRYSTRCNPPTVFRYGGNERMRRSVTRNDAHLLKHSKEQPIRTRQCYRQPYEQWQVEMLKKEFRSNRHIDKERRAELADATHLTPYQIKVWFQNRRSKERRRAGLGI